MGLLQQMFLMAIATLLRSLVPDASVHSRTRISQALWKLRSMLIFFQAHIVESTLCNAQPNLADISVCVAKFYNRPVVAHRGM